MKPRRLLPSVATALAVVVVFNLAVAAVTQLTARRKFLERLDHIPPDTELLFVGNSLMEYGIDLEAFAAAWTPPGPAPRAFSAALHSTTPVEHVLVLRQALARLPHVKTLVYGTVDDQLSVRPRTGWRDMISSRALAFSFPAEAAALYAPGSWETAWSFRIQALVPMLADRTTFWVKVEGLRVALRAWGMPPSPEDKEDLAELTGRLEGLVRDERPFSPAVQEFFRLAGSRDGLQLIVVEMPSGHPLEFHDGRAASALRAYNRARVEAVHGLYLDASDWIMDRADYQEDGYHLNPKGAQRFSERLGRELSREGGARRGD